MSATGCTCIATIHAVEESVVYRGERLSRRRVVQMRPLADPFCPATHAGPAVSAEPDWTPGTG